jgi:hypothetical protein
MTAMKKTTSKPAAKSSAPATKAASTAKASTAKAPIVKAPVPVKKAASAVKPAKPAVKLAKPAVKTKTAAPVAAVPVAAAAPAVKPVPTKPVVTTVTAQIDIGFGNALFLRGEGAGLNWDTGLLMTCVNDHQWSVVLGESARPIVFKFLVNDLSWSAGEDYSVAAGSSVTLVPTF